MKKILYFAYGSNMLFKRINSRLGYLNAIKVIGTYKLYNYKLLFNTESSNGLNNFLNIVKATPNDFVEGILYELTEQQFKVLDSYEALYYRYFFDIDKDTLACTYICTNPNNLGERYTPDEFYIDYCINGALENNLSHTAKYLMYLKENINFNKCKRTTNFKNY